jgi:hypothetical protein
VKLDLKAEWFLGDPKCGERRWVALRGGNACLAVVRGRWRRIPRDQRVCEWCGLGLVEDERHFLDVCERWASERRGLWEGMTEVDRRTVGLVAGWSSHARMDWLLAGGSARTKVVVVRMVGSLLAKREELGEGKEGSRGWGEKPSAGEQRKVGVRTRGPGLRLMLQAESAAALERKEMEMAARKAAAGAREATVRAERSTAAVKRGQRAAQREESRLSRRFTERQRSEAGAAAASAAIAAAISAADWCCGMSECGCE